MAIPQHILDAIRGIGSETTSGAEPKRGAAIFEGTDYPTDWSGFIGQTRAIELLRVHLASALARGTRIEHTLLASGIHGVGKTTLATLLAYNAGVGFVQTTGPLDAFDAQRLISGMQDRDILFIDEAHLLVQGNRNKADWLLPFMTEGKFYTATGAKQMPDIAIVAATTDVGKLPETLISRFMLQPEIVAYSATEAGRIVESLAGRMQVPVNERSDCERIAAAADHNPRAMRRILTAIRDLQYAYPETHPNLDRAFAWAGVSPDGLTTLARDMLLILVTSPQHTASIDSIRAHLNEPGPIRHAEQSLLQRGLITITGRGRQLTDIGLARARREVTVRAV